MGGLDGVDRPRAVDHRQAKIAGDRPLPAADHPGFRRRNCCLQDHPPLGASGDPACPPRLHTDRRGGSRPLYAPDRELVADYPTYDDRKSFWRLPTRYASIQAIDYTGDYPLILTTGRLVEYEGGGDETRSNAWLAELRSKRQLAEAEFECRYATGRDRDDAADWRDSLQRQLDELKRVERR